MRRSAAPSIKCTTSPVVVTASIASVLNRSPNESSSSISQPNTTVDSESIKYYSVLYGKASTRKHKKYDDDGIIIVNGRRVTLKDLHGQVIATSGQLSQTKLLSFELGVRFSMSDKDLEIQNEISQNEATGSMKRAKYDENAGSPSTSTPGVRPLSTSPVTSSTSVLDIAIRRKFVLPSMKATKPVSPAKAASRSSLHDANGRNALVLPRPMDANSKVDITDVVVDPFLVAKLRPHQRKGVTFMYESIMSMKKVRYYFVDEDYDGIESWHKINGAILADEMGLGKTLQCIALIWTLIKQGPYARKPLVERVLIVTPSSLVDNWAAEFKKWLGNERINVFTASTAQDVTDYMKTKSTMFPILIASYDLLLRCSDYLTNFDKNPDEYEIEPVTFDLLICDEGHRLKNSTVKGNKFLSKLDIKKRILLSGTPLQNDLQEMFALCDFVNPGIFGSSRKFSRFFQDPILKGQLPNTSEAEQFLAADRSQQLNGLMNNFMLRRTAEINKNFLPPKDEFIVFCKPSEVQKELYNSILSCNALKKCSTVPQHFECIDLLRKLCNHPILLAQSVKSKKKKSSVLDQEDAKVSLSLKEEILPIIPKQLFSADITVDDSSKLAVSYQIILTVKETLFEKLVFVSNFTKTLDLVQDLCNASDIKTLRLDGSTPKGLRQQMVNQFNRPRASNNDDAFVFLLSAKAGGLGLNLIGASRLILFEPEWNPAIDLQALARIWRDGQTAARVQIYRLITAGTIEEKIFQRQVKKQGLSGTVVDWSSCVNSTKTDYSQFSMQELKHVFEFTECDCKTHELLECPCQGSGQKYSAENINRKDLAVQELPINFKSASEVQIDDDDDDDEVAGNENKPSKKFELRNVEIDNNKDDRFSIAKLYDWSHFSAENLSNCEQANDSYLINSDSSTLKNISFVFYFCGDL